MEFFTVPRSYRAKGQFHTLPFTRRGLVPQFIGRIFLCPLLLLVSPPGADATPVSRSLSSSAVQDQSVVRGRVTDANGNGLTGVSISLKETGSGTATDAAGM